MRAALLLGRRSSGIRQTTSTTTRAALDLAARHRSLAAAAAAGSNMSAAADADADARTRAPPFPTPQALSAWLRERGVSTESWGKGSAKSVEDLWEEVQAGESELFEQKEEEQQRAPTPPPPPPPTTPLRRVRVVSLTLLSPDDPPLALAEASQALPDGRVRRRGLLPLSEKMCAADGGCWRQAAERGVREELGSAAAVQGAASSSSSSSPPTPLVLLDEASYAVESGSVRDAASYPGLPTLYEMHRARGRLCPRAFAAVLPAALRLKNGRRAGSGGTEATAEAEEAETGVSPPLLEFETEELVEEGGMVVRTTWRWVAEGEVGGGGGGG